MRRFISLGVLALIFAFFSSSVSADLLDCEMDLKGNKKFKSLYGLCVAFWSADENGRDQLLEIYRKKANKLDAPPELLDPPGYTDGPVQNSEPCACWNIDEIRDYLACGGFSIEPGSEEIDTSADYSGTHQVVFFDAADTAYPQFKAGNYGHPDGNICRIGGGLPAELNLVAPASWSLLSQDSEESCRKDIEGLIMFPPSMGECPPVNP